MQSISFSSPGIYLESGSKAICIHHCYNISSNHQSNSLTKLVPVYPSYTVVKRDIRGMNLYVDFCVNSRDFDKAKNLNIEISHIAEYILEIGKTGNCSSNCCIYCYIYHQTAFIFVKRISDVIFSNIFNFETAEDLLYQIHGIFVGIKLNQQNDKIVLLGEIQEESQITRLLKIYFTNIFIETNFQFFGNRV